MCDACEKQPCRFVLKEDIDELLGNLDSIARGFVEGDNYDKSQRKSHRGDMR